MMNTQDGDALLHKEAQGCMSEGGDLTLRMERAGEEIEHQGGLPGRRRPVNLVLKGK